MFFGPLAFVMSFPYNRNKPFMDSITNKYIQRFERFQTTGNPSYLDPEGNLFRENVERMKNGKF